MRQLPSLLSVAVLASLSCACDGFTLFVSAGPLRESRTSSTPSPPPRSIVPGETVTGTFIVPEVRFDLHAPRSGTLLIRIAWDRRHGDLDLAFLSTVLSTTSGDDASVTGMLRVAPGQDYQIIVVGDQGPVPFTLTTSLE